ncbi:MAG: DmsE family decaheme c-type cytochrome [Vicinamibacterales bacterium]
MECPGVVRARALCVVAAAVAWLVLPGPAAASTTAGDQVVSAGYVGEETCLSCHEGQTRGYDGSVHARAWNAATPMANHGCESCHGPGQAHVDAGGDPSRIRTFASTATARETSAACLECHASGARAMWQGSQHDFRGMACTSCHSVHEPKSDRRLLRTSLQIETCQQCHRGEVQKLHRSSHMPVAEGQLECSSCHNPHGSSNERLLKVGMSVNQSCEGCHADKRGPHLWEHAPVTERCTTCHDAHGSTNDRMLVAKAPFLCQRCHVSAQHPSTAYDGYQLQATTNANRVYGRSCAACHQNIHGSNAPSGRAFLR